MVNKAKIATLLSSARGCIYEHPRVGKYFSGYGTGIFTWECYFDAIMLYHAGYESSDIAKNLLAIHLMNQDPQTGHIPRHSPDLSEDRKGYRPEGWNMLYKEIGGEMVNPFRFYEQEEHAQPFLYQIAYFITRLEGSTGWLTDDLYEGLKKYIVLWLTDWDRAKNGLCVLASAQHAGTDVSFTRAGAWCSYFAETPDINTFLYLELVCAAKLAEAMERAEDARYFRKQAQIKKEKINELLWNELAGTYFGLDIRTMEHIRVDTIQGYFPMWAGIAPPARAERMVREHLLDSRKFWTKYPFSSYAMDEPSYTQHHKNDSILLDDYVLLPSGHCNWRGGVWAHPHYFMCYALNRYGYADIAMEVAEKIYALTIDNPYMSEWHNAETGEMLGARINAGVQIFQRMMPALLESGFDMDCVSQALTDKIDNGSLRRRIGTEAAWEI